MCGSILGVDCLYLVALAGLLEENWAGLVPGHSDSVLGRYLEAIVGPAEILEHVVPRPPWWTAGAGARMDWAV